MFTSQSLRSSRLAGNITGWEIHSLIGITFSVIYGPASTSQLRGLIPFPSIVTHRRLANLDSFVHNHTAGLFVLVGQSYLAWAGHLVHIAHPLQGLSSDGVHHEYVPELGAHVAGLQST